MQMLSFYLIVSLIFYKYGPNPASFLISSFSQYNDKNSSKLNYIQA